MDYTDGNLTGVETALSNMNNSLNELTTDIDTFKTKMQAIETACSTSCTLFPNFASAGTDIDSSSVSECSIRFNLIQKLYLKMVTQ